MPRDAFVSESNQPFPAVLAALAAESSDQVVITVGDDRLSRGRWERDANRVGRMLRDGGVARGDLVALIMGNGLDWFRAALGIWKIGATPMPLSPSAAREEIDALIGIARPAAVLAEPGFVVEGTPVHTIEESRQYDDAELPVGTSPHWKALTSGGSTGLPKVIVSAWPTSFDPDAGQRLFRIAPKDRVLIATPLAHNYAVMCAVMALIQGSEIHVMARFDAETALRIITEQRIQHLPVVPTIMSRMLKAYRADPERYSLDSVTTLLHMAEPCAPWLKSEWIDLLGPEVVLEQYGSTEQQALTRLTGSEWREHAGSIGRVFDGELMVVDEEGRPVPVGQDGEIYMRPGENLPPRYRYLNAEAKTLPGGWESVGDLGHVDDDGFVYLSDRRVDMFTVGGRNVYPAEIEAVLSEHDAVGSCIVFGVPDDDLGQVPYALVEANADVTQEDLIDYLSRRLASYRIPRAIEFRSEPLRNDVGKARRSQLRQEVLDRLHS